jgi:DNA-binding NarL/FixJ family response regulator
MIRGREPPLLLLTGPVPEARWRSPLEAAGWLVRDPDEDLPLPGSDRTSPTGQPTVLVLSLRDRADVARILRLVIAGFGVVCEVDLADPLAAELHEDLRRLGSVTVLPDAEGEAPGRSEAVSAAPDPDTLALLRSLSTGHTLGEAARSVHLSRRTADRRLAAVRRALGVATTLEAVVAARRAGWLDAGPGTEP